MKTRSEIEEKFKWDLSTLCTSDEEFYSKLNEIKPQLDKLQEYKGKLNNKEVIWDYLCFDRSISKVLDPLQIYAYLKSDEVVSDNARNEMVETISNMLSKVSYETSFISSELHALSDEFLDELIADEKFKDYDKFFKDIKDDKKHILSPAEEKLLSGMDFLGGFSENMHKLSDADINFGEIEDEKGEKHALTNSNYSKYMRCADRTLRKNSFARLNGEFGNHINMLSSNYISEVKANCYFAKVRNYPSALERALENEEVDEKVYFTLLNQVNKNLPVLFDYYKLKQKEMKLDDFYIYDTLAGELGENKAEKQYTYDEAIEIIKKAVAPLGEEYVGLIQRAKDERWIDVYPNKDKASGAYCNSIYGHHPYVLTNFEGQIDDVFTLAHELGHAMHSYFSSKCQPETKSYYTIFLAEIASITNEMLLINYLLSVAKSDDEKKNLYNKLFDEVKGSIYRQTMFAEFEQTMHSMNENDVPLTKDKVCDTYCDIVKKYFGHVKLIDEIKYEWARIPHFFRGFYVYKYSTGMICAIAFANRILSGKKGAVEDYFKFLSAGGCDTPITILKNAGCDITDEKTFEGCFDYLRLMLNEWQKLI
ncbi:MAG: oligoendopeptidase F [Clostridia bacterium]|nr:oligoendopeptidase F [Clostridia bacterium]